MEVAARELIPALRDAAPGVALHRVRQPRGGRRGPRRRARRACPVDARATASSGCAASSSCCRGWPRRAGCDLVHSLALDGARARPLRARHDDPRPQLPDRARGALRRARRSACACSCRSPRGARTASSPTRESTRDDLVERLRRAARRRSTSCRSGSGRPARRAPTPERRAARAARRSATGRSCSRSRPSARTRTSRGLLDALARIPAERRPVLVLPGYPTPHEAELRAHADALGVDGRRALPRLDEPTRTSRACYALRRRVRVPVALRGLRPAGARGDGARRAGRVLGPRVAARGRRRRGAALRPRATRRRSPRRSSGCSATRPRPSGCAPPGRAQAARFTWERDRRADARELRARARVARSSRRRASSELSSDSRCGVAREPRRAVARAQRGAGLVHAHDRVGEVLGRGAGGDEAVDALLDQLGRGVVRRRARRRSACPRAPPRRRPARSPRGATAAPGTARARSVVLDLARSRRSPARRRRPSSPCAAIAASTAARSGPSPKIAPRSSGSALARARDGRHDAPARASRGCGARRTRRPARRAAGAARLERPGVLALEHRRPRRAAPSARSRPRCSRAKQNARWRHAQAQRLHARSRRGPPAPPRYSRQYARAPHLVPVDDEPEAAAAAARAPAASSEKYGNDAVWTTS